MNSRQRRWRAVIVMAVAAGMLLAGWILWTRGPSRETSVATAGPSTWRQTEPDPDYVGSQACRECHAGIADRYAGHPMAASLFVPDSLPAETESDRVEFSPDPARRYVVALEKSRIVHHEIGLDRRGEEIFDQSFAVSLAIGSGQRGRSYVIERAGRLFLSPVSWYASDARFDLSPGYTGTDHKRFSREAHVRCLHCHSGGIRTEQPTERVEDRFYELSISCERCHGPGREHIAWHRQASHTDSGADPDNGADPIVNPVALDPVRRDAVCNQCHLQGDTEILRHGRIYTDFRPGELLGQTQSIYVAGAGVDETSSTVAVSHTLQMETSRCYIASHGRLGCISCHDPHSVPDESHRVAWYRQKCLTCHDQQGCGLAESDQNRPPARGSCIVCHMPGLSASDVPHTVQTDHRILKSPEAASFSPARGPSEGLRIFDLDACPLPDADHRRAHGLFLAEQAEHTQNMRTVQQAGKLLRQLPDRFTADPVVLDRQALIASMSGRSALGERLWQQLVARTPEFRNGWLSLAILARNAGNPDQAIEYLDRVIALDSVNADLRYQRVMLYQSLDRKEDALNEIRVCVSLDPSRAAYRQTWAELAQALGKDDVAAREFRNARRLRGE